MCILPVSKLSNGNQEHNKVEVYPRKKTLNKVGFTNLQ
jgi:hypothetical protein